MPKNYVRVDAVGFGHSIYDSDDISAIRGGSFLALDAILQLKKEFENELETITDSASIGLYKVKNGNSTDGLEDKILSFLRRHTGGHVSFAVKMLNKGGKSFGEINACLAAANRWSQMQMMTIPMKGVWDSSDGPCAIDGVRPGKMRDANEFHSDSVHFRRKQGRDLRRTIYKKIVPDIPNLEFTDNLEELSGKGKIAFIYLDGNKFGKIRNFNSRDENQLRKYDETIRDHFRIPLLRQVVTHMWKESEKNTDKKNEKKICLETLLWGGDEIEWVAPARNALDILRLLYEFPPPCSPYEFDEKKPSDNGSVPLTHAAGVVFCNYNAPILHIRKLARNLAKMVKDGMSDVPRTPDEGNLFHYMVLDSFDMLGGDAQSYIKEYYDPADYSSLIIKGSELKSFVENMRTLKASYPRGKIYEIIDSLTKCGDAKSVSDIWERGLSQCGKQTESVESAMKALVETGIEKWFTVADLWDFIPKEDR